MSPSSRKAWHRVLGLALLDADFVTLVEVFPESHIRFLAGELAVKGLECEVTLLPQPESHLGIGFPHKPGIAVANPRFVPGSQGEYTGGRQALAVDVSIGTRFRAVVIGVHPKSGRDADDQALRDSQCRAIGEWITALHETPGYKRHAILLMGDFNMIPGQDVSNFYHLGGADMMDYVSSWDRRTGFRISSGAAVRTSSTASRSAGATRRATSSVRSGSLPCTGRSAWGARSSVPGSPTTCPSSPRSGCS